MWTSIESTKSSGMVNRLHTVAAFGRGHAGQSRRRKSQHRTAQSERVCAPLLQRIARITPTVYPCCRKWYCNCMCQRCQRCAQAQKERLQTSLTALSRGARRSLPRGLLRRGQRPIPTLKQGRRWAEDRAGACRGSHRPASCPQIPRLQPLEEGPTWVPRGGLRFHAPLGTVPTFPTFDSVTHTRAGSLLQSALLA